MAEKVSVFKGVFRIIVFFAIFFLSFWGFRTVVTMLDEKRALQEVILRLSANSRVAQVIVSDVRFNPMTQKHMTTIKFLEYDSRLRPMEPKYFTFSGDLIQFQSLVVRFDDTHVKNADALRGKSAYLFWKVFVLDGAQTQEYVISPVHEVPKGYKVPSAKNPFEDAIWAEFWEVALNPKKAGQRGIKSAQIEAPGTKFVPGLLYTIKIEHNGGMRIDASEIPDVLKGERVMN